MATYKYYIEPTSYDRGFSKATSHIGEWNTVIIDLGEVSPGKHQVYSLVDGHVEASTGYLMDCAEIDLANYLEIIGNNKDYIHNDYLIEGEVYTYMLQRLSEGEAPYIQVWDCLPASLDENDEPIMLIMDEVNLDEFAEKLGLVDISYLETVIGYDNPQAVSEAITSAVDGF